LPLIESAFPLARCTASARDASDLETQALAFHTQRFDKEPHWACPTPQILELGVNTAQLLIQQQLSGAPWAVLGCMNPTVFVFPSGMANLPMAHGRKQSAAREQLSEGGVLFLTARAL